MEDAVLAPEFRAIEGEQRQLPPKVGLGITRPVPGPPSPTMPYNAAPVDPPPVFGAPRHALAPGAQPTPRPALGNLRHKF